MAEAVFGQPPPGRSRDSGWQLALGAKRRRRSGKAAADIGGGVPTAKPVKIVRFADSCLWYDIEDDGTDEFTFDNVWLDGMPASPKLIDHVMKLRYE